MSERPEFCPAATGRINAEGARCELDEYGVHRCADTFAEVHGIHTCMCEFQWSSAAFTPEELVELNVEE